MYITGVVEPLAQPAMRDYAVDRHGNARAQRSIHRKARLDARKALVKRIQHLPNRGPGDPDSVNAAGQVAMKCGNPNRVHLRVLAPDCLHHTAW